LGATDLGVAELGLPGYPGAPPHLSTGSRWKAAWSDMFVGCGHGHDAMGGGVHRRLGHPTPNPG
jgi:hypothetical protein